MTTDTKPKTASRQAGQATLLGIAKGAAMIHPNMATLLAVVTSDAAIQPDALQAMLRRAAGRSFNAITVDGDQSTNDTLLVLANGLAGPVDAAAFEQALTEVCQSLAQQMVRDAEGAVRHVGIFAAVPYCIDLIGGPYIETDEAVIKAFRPKHAIRPRQA